MPSKMLHNYIPNTMDSSTDDARNDAPEMFTYMDHVWRFAFPSDIRAKHCGQHLPYCRNEAIVVVTNFIDI